MPPLVDPIADPLACPLVEPGLVLLMLAAPCPVEPLTDVPVAPVEVEPVVWAIAKPPAAMVATAAIRANFLFIGFPPRRSIRRQGNSRGAPRRPTLIFRHSLLGLAVLWSVL